MEKFIEMETGDEGEKRVKTNIEAHFSALAN